MRDKYIRCAECDANVHYLELFPNDLCLACYETLWEQAQQGKTAEQVAQDLHNTIVGTFGK
jgi:hypothetical protein